MSLRSCNRYANLSGRSPAGFRAFSSLFSAKGSRRARKKAQSRLLFSGLFLAALASLWGCAPGPEAAGHSAPARPEIDAVLPTDGPAAGAWNLFRLGTQRYARVPGDSVAWAGEASTRAEWKTLPSPGGPFRPVQAVQAARGYFLLVDAASSRLCLYDTTAGLISTFPMPERFTPFPAGRAAVFRGVDGTFIFADYASGEAWQYADREGAQGAASWVLRARVKMPMGWRDCYQQPGTEGLACRVSAGASRFDGALNRASGTPATPPESRLSWDANTQEWILTGVAPADGSPLFRFRPARRAVDPP